MNKGQISLEYFILFAIVALLTFVALTSFDDNIKNSLDAVFKKTMEKFQ